MKFEGSHDKIDGPQMAEEMAYASDINRTRQVMATGPSKEYDETKAGMDAMRQEGFAAVEYEIRQATEGKTSEEIEPLYREASNQVREAEEATYNAVRLGQDQAVPYINLDIAQHREKFLNKIYSEKTWKEQAEKIKKSESGQY